MVLTDELQAGRIMDAGVVPATPASMDQVVLVAGDARLKDVHVNGSSRTRAGENFVLILYGLGDFARFPVDAGNAHGFHVHVALERPSGSDCPRLFELTSHVERQIPSAVRASPSIVRTTKYFRSL